MVGALIQKSFSAEEAENTTFIILVVGRSMGEDRAVFAEKPAWSAACR
jgi:hypothetical protein